jgi:hypothetical protein
MIYLIYLVIKIFLLNLFFLKLLIFHLSNLLFNFILLIKILAFLKVLYLLILNF